MGEVFHGSDDTRPRHDRAWDQRVGGLSGLPDLLRRLDVNPDAVLAAAGLSPDALADPDDRIAYTACGLLLECSRETTQHPAFGLLSGRLWHLGDLGLLGEMMRNSATVGEALRVLATYQHLDSGGGLSFVMQRAAIVDLGYAIFAPGVKGADLIYDLVLAATFNFMRELAGAAWMPSEVFVPHAKPRDPLHYRNLFKVVPSFNAEFCAFRFPAYWLDRPIEGAVPARKRSAMQLADRAGSPHLVEQVQRALRTLLLHGKCSGDDVAFMLAMHRRTLNRRLREHETTFQKLLDDVRCDVAQQLLAYSDIPLDDIAASLSYSSVSPFMRSFHRWTGMAPGQCRRRARQERKAQARRELALNSVGTPPASAPQGLTLRAREHAVEGPASPVPNSDPADPDGTARRASRPGGAPHALIGV